MKYFIDYTKRIFPTYKVLCQDVKRVSKITGKQYYNWKCLCNCGNIFNITSKQIYRGVRKSCGCLSKANRFKKIDDKDYIVNLKYGHYTNSAKRRNIKWDLTKDKFREYIFANCFYCKNPPLLLVIRKGRKMFINGVDRKDSNLSYTIDNCVPCCHFCNNAKQDYSLNEFLNWLESLKK